MKKLIPALALLVVSAVLMGTSTFAWFSLNNKVTVTGMQVRTQVGDSLLIAPTTTAETGKEDEGDFKRTFAPTDIDALLEPVSTVDGVTFFYNSTANVVADGDAASDSYVAYTPGDTAAFNSNYGTTGAVGYVDYAFQLKAFNSNTSASAYVNMTKLQLTYGGDDDLAEKAFRVAVFVNDMGTDGATAATAPSSSVLKTILRPTGAQYFGISGDHTDKAVSGASAAPTDVNAKIDDAALIGTLANGATNYYKVVVRLWLEGEDNTCTNTTFAELTESWMLDLEIEIQNATGGVTALALAERGSALQDLTEAESAAEAVKDIDGVSYYKLGSTDYYIKRASSNVKATDRIYQLKDKNGVLYGGGGAVAPYYPVDVTNQCKAYYVVTITNSLSGTVTAPGFVKVYKGDLPQDVALTGFLTASHQVTGSDITMTPADGKITITAITADTTITIANKA